MGEFAALTSSIVWACASLLYMRLGARFSPKALNFLKSAMALVLLLLTFVIVEGRLWPTELSWTGFLWLAGSGIIGFTLGDTAFFYGLSRLGPRIALLLTTLTPPITGVLAFIFLKEPLTNVFLIGMVLTMTGIGVVIWEREQDLKKTDSSKEPATHSSSPDESVEDSTANEKLSSSPVSSRKVFWLGVGGAVLANLAQAVVNVITRYAGSETTALGISIVRLSVGVVGLMFFMGMTSRTLEQIRPSAHPKSVWGTLFAAMMLGTYLGIWLSMAGIRYSGHTGIATTLGSTSPLFVLPLTYWFLKEKLSRASIAGAFLAVSGIAFLFVGDSLMKWLMP